MPKKSKEPRKTTKGKGRNFRTVKEGAGMTKKGVKEYRKKNPGSKLKTAVTGKVKKGSKAAKRRKSFCARSKGWKGERGRAARRRWKC
jgi:gas vesicle protein|tara:strand:- start:338 stop:601 length:264 start_codon:yes stop_codon:yes gene_type:complete